MRVLKSVFYNSLGYEGKSPILYILLKQPRQFLPFLRWGHHDHMVVELPLPSVPITTNVVSSNPAHDDVYSIQHYVIKFVSDL